MKNAFEWFMNNIRLFAILAACGALIGLGHTWGAAGVQSDWDKDKIAQAKALSDMEAKWRAKSVEYQNLLAAQKKRIQSNRKAVQYAIHHSYPACVADNDIVRLWRDSFSGESATR